MDSRKVGSLICSLRKEKGMTQRELADSLHISDKTVSKWERGQGCPDVSLLGNLALRLGISMENLLSGELDQKEADGGNMKRMKFYVCPECGLFLTSTGEVDCSCCGRKLVPLTPSREPEGHEARIEEVEDECLITIDHVMMKDHYISFVACVSGDRVTLVRLYPEQSAMVRLPWVGRGIYYYYCTKHGLFQMEQVKSGRRS